MSKTSFLPGTITIARPQGHDCDYITIEIRDKASTVEFVEVSIKYADFALALTGMGYTPCEFNLRDTKLVGSTHEHKTEVILFDRYVPEEDPALKAALAPYEVEDWVGNVSDLLNGHHRVKGGQEVGFVRYVNVKGEPIL